MNDRSRRGASGSSSSARHAADEGALLKRLRAGDDAAFEELVRASSGPMLALARRYARSEEDAREIVQEAFLQAFRGLDGFHGDARLSTWLHRITINTSLMRLRHQQRRPEASLEDLLPEFDEDGHRIDPGSAWATPAIEKLQSKETRSLVRSKIESLPADYRDVLLLRDIQGLDTEETATLIGIKPGTVKVRLHRARQALRTLLDRHVARGEI